jgi:hypothetical protein
MTKTEDLVPKIARNEMFYFIARVCMIVASTLGAPIALWLGSRLVTQADATQAAIIQQNLQLQLLTSTVKDKFESATLQLSDHELRLRTIEHNRQN